MDDREKDIARENQESKESGQKQYEFITETIKKRPVNKKRVFLKFCMNVVLGIVFGVVACVTFAIAYPHINGKINPEEPKQVTLPVAEEETKEEPIEEFVPKDEEEDLAEMQKVDESIAKDGESGDAETAPAEDPADAPDGETAAEDDKEVVINQVVETVEKDLELDDFRMLYRKISAVGTSVQKSLVTVSGISSDTDWFNNEFESNNSAAGVIVADNGMELLIVSMTEQLRNADNVQVTFCDGKSYPCSIKQTDPSTGLTVVAVKIDDIDSKTMSNIEMATFGSVSSLMVGVPILALGSPLGIADSMAIGQITSTSTVVDMTDNSAKVVSTDIYGSPLASGVIVNLNGRILGFICHEDIDSYMPNLIRAYSITDLKDKIEKLSNGQNLAMLGIFGTDVTESAYNELGVPFGTYVKTVDIDSPAMEAGIRSGDVIVKMGTTEIKSFVDFKSSMLKMTPGDVVAVTLMRPGRDGYKELTYEVSLRMMK